MDFRARFTSKIFGKGLEVQGLAFEVLGFGGALDSRLLVLKGL